MGFAAGRFYPANREELISLLEELFKGLKEEYDLKAGIVPHAGYIFSGFTANIAYKTLNSSDKKRVIVVGPSRLGGLADVSLIDIETPLGIATTNKELVMKLIELGFSNAEEAFTYEHSVEVQVPFLQYKLGNNFMIVPSIMKNYYDFAKEIGKLLAETLSDKDVLVISSDFTHYGPFYDYVPFEDGRKVKELDMKLIERILNLDSYGFYKLIKETGATVCGWGPIVSVIEFAKERELEPILLDYYTSGDVTRDYSNVVGYASILFQ